MGSHRSGPFGPKRVRENGHKHDCECDDCKVENVFDKMEGHCDHSALLEYEKAKMEMELQHQRLQAQHRLAEQGK